MAVSVRLEKDLDERLEKLSAETGRTKSYYIREALIEKIEDLEDIYLAEERVEKSEKIYSLNELEENLELEN